LIEADCLNGRPGKFSCRAGLYSRAGAGKGTTMGLKTFEEIIRFAIKREESAYHLYKTAAERAQSLAARKMFEEMAAEEAGHKATFEKLDLETAENYKFSPHADMKLAEYMADIPFREDMSYPEILHYALKTEENAYKLYTAAAEMTDNPRLKKMLLVLADVEKGHKARIETMYDEKVLTEM
jgi:rubrerythrin